MSIDLLGNIFMFLGGLGMFLYGMNIMGDGMQKAAGSKMSSVLRLVTDNRLLAIALGAFITAMVHSSSATTVMVVGFVNAGILNLTQAVGVIMGANIGTTITAWMVSMNELGDAMKIFQPSFFAPLFVGLGSFGLMFAKKKDNLVAEILIGMGLLFCGLTYMSGAVKPYADSPIFANAFAVLGGNPILGILVGAGVTALIQSSTASVGILQTLAMSGMVNTSAAIYITLGQNMGTCVTALISSTGANRNAKRASAIHLLFNATGAVLFGIGMFALTFIAPEFANAPIDSLKISIFHTIFNVTNTIILFPFAKQLVKISGLLIKETPEEKAAEQAVEKEEDVLQLDQRIFQSPPMALEVAAMEVVHMGKMVEKNLKLAIDAILNSDYDKLPEVHKHEAAINAVNKKLTEYLVQVNNLSLTDKQKREVSNLFYTVSDLERIGDHAENLAESAEFLQEHKLQFSEVGLEDLKWITGVANSVVSYAVTARQDMNLDAVRKVSKLEDEMDTLEEEMREKHIERLSKQICNPSSGVIFLDIVSNLERISDHAYNVAGYVKDEL
ncbi:MAG: Na/Pi cotransporter family protein [Lachnospiraceae bacterium]|nr:Na/Pi cotransporter family protein [Lachnospiraceae bacterium]